MNFERLLSHFTQHNFCKIGSTKFILATFNSDPTGQARTVIVDVSHQRRTQPNYLSSLNNVMNLWQCRDVIIYLNVATNNLRPSFQANAWCFIDANAEPIFVNGYELFPIVDQDEYVSGYAGLYCFSPDLRRCLNEADV